MGNWIFGWGVGEQDFCKGPVFFGENENFGRVSRQ